MASRLLILALCIVPVSAFIGKSSHTTIGSSKSRPTMAATTETMDASQEQTESLKKSGSARVTFASQRSHSTHITVQHRDFGEFLKSAAWPYITVAKSIERIDDKTYRCEAEPVRFGKSDIVVFLDVKVDVDASKPRALIQVASGKVKETEGTAENKSRFSFNGGIDASSVRMKNRVVVTWEQIDENTIKVTSDSSLETSMHKPAWLPAPELIMKRIRGMIMQQVLRKELPGLHDRLSQGYYAWCAARPTYSLSGPLML